VDDLPIGRVAAGASHLPRCVAELVSIGRYLPCGGRGTLRGEPGERRWVGNGRVDDIVEAVLGILANAGAEVDGLVDLLSRSRNADAFVGRCARVSGSGHSGSVADLAGWVAPVRKREGFREVHCRLGR
jgi:hypothetical protein